MPPNVRVTREQILAAALETVRAEGPEALNARALAARLGCSTQPIFKNFASMEALRQSVIASAEALWRERMQAKPTADYPPYKSLGMAYIAFAGQEPQLFRLLFMRNRAQEAQSEDELGEWLPTVERATGLRGEAATLFHLEIWALVHGIAVMHATGYVRLDEAVVSRVLTDVFLGLKHRWEEANERD